MATRLVAEQRVETLRSVLIPDAEGELQELNKELEQAREAAQVADARAAITAATARIAARDVRPGRLAGRAGGPPAWIADRMQKMQQKNAILRELGLLQEGE